MRALAHLNALRVLSLLPVSRLTVPGVSAQQLYQPDDLGYRPLYSTMASADEGKAFHDPSTGQLGSKAPAEDTVLDSAPEVAKVAEAELKLDGADPLGLKAPAKEAEKAAEPKLPPLTAHEFKQYNRLAEHMNYFHEHFRHTWDTLYGACETGKRPAGMSLKQFIDEGLQFIRHLTAHHDIEETYVFPLLAAKMPEFKGTRQGGNAKAAELLQQHKEIHKGMDDFEAYLKQCRNKEVEFELGVLKTKMDGWRAVLWKHLDQEVQTLGAENSKYLPAEAAGRCIVC
jgi:hemerythrin-like domain-containing protein